MFCCKSKHITDIENRTIYQNKMLLVTTVHPCLRDTALVKLNIEPRCEFVGQSFMDFRYKVFFTIPSKNHKDTFTISAVLFYNYKNKSINDYYKSPTFIDNYPFQCDTPFLYINQTESIFCWSRVLDHYTLLGTLFNLKDSIIVRAEANLTDTSKFGEVKVFFHDLFSDLEIIKDTQCKERSQKYPR